MSRADVIAGVLAEHHRSSSQAGWPGSPDPSDWRNIRPTCICGERIISESRWTPSEVYAAHRGHVAAVLAAAELAAVVSAEAIDSADCPCGHGVHLHHPAGGPCAGRSYGAPEDGFPERHPCDCDRTLGDALLASGALTAEPAAEQAHALAPADAEAALARVGALADRWDALDLSSPYREQDIEYGGRRIQAEICADDLRAALTPADHDRRNT